ETLRLVQPGVTPAQDLVISEVTYDSKLPWPTNADGTGASLQLIDPTQDTRRVANWAAVQTDPNTQNGWRFISITGTASSSNLIFYLASAGDVYLDDISLVAGSVPGVGADLVQNGDFEAPLLGTWIISDSDPDTSLSTSVKHSGQNSIHVVSSSGGNIFLP